MRALACVLAALFGVAMVAMAGPAPRPARGKEFQLAGIQLGKKAASVAITYGSPTRVQVGPVTAAGVPGLGGPGGMMGMGGPGAGMMPAAGGMEGMMPGMGGMGGLDPGGAAMPYPGMGGMPMMDPTGGAAMPGMGMGGPMGPLAPGGPGMAGPEAGLDMGMGGMPGQTWMPQNVHWIYEVSKKGVILIFGINDEGHVVSVTVGDGYPDSVSRGGPRRVSFGARTARGITLGDDFRKVVTAYGYPETQQQLGNEVVLTYYSRFGVAFAMRQETMKLTAITIREMPETGE
ncbi:MAG: hypothetical protein HY321_02455 [Armatimonadetes bacterium]|nr:hypothetical protein [Armatimonadota bacterium]